MSKYSKEELKAMAKVIMFNPHSDKSQRLVNYLSVVFMLQPQQVLNKIRSLSL